MKKTLLLSIFLCLSYLLGAQNLIQNPSFELATNAPVNLTNHVNSGVAPDKWSLTVTTPASNEGTLSVVTDEFQDQNKSMKLDLAKINARYQLYLWYEMLNLTPGIYEYSFYTKASIANVAFRVDVTTFDALALAYDKGTNAIITNGKDGVEKKTTTDWVKHTFTLDLSGKTADELKAVRLFIRPNCDQNGNVNKTNIPISYWFDNFTFEKEKTVVYGENLINDFGFENGTVTVKKQATDLMTAQNSNGWVHLLKDASNNEGELSVVADEHNNGSKSLKLDLVKIGARFNFYMAYELTDLKPGKYIYSFYVKTNSATERPFRVEILATPTTNAKIDAGGKYLIGADITGVVEKVSNTWKKISYEIDATNFSEAELKYVNLVLRPNCKSTGGSGVENTPTTYWFDDFEFKKEETEDPDPGHDPAYPRFAAISDIHVGRDGGGGGGGWKAKLTRALNVLKAQTPALDAIFIVGDITERGTKAEFETAKAEVEALVGSIPVYYNLGNHDWWDTSINAANEFKNIFGQEVNYYTQIKGYPVILISMENKDQTSAYLNTTRTFLSTSLADAKANYPNKPIFVFQHVPNSRTVYGSYEIGGNDSWGTATIEDILKDYPQVISIAGHSHFPLADERSIHQDKYTSINDGSVAYAEVESGFANTTTGSNRPTDSEKIQEGIIISLDKDETVTVKRLDFFNNVEIKQPWEIKAPHDGTAFAYKGRDGGVAPTFAPGAKVALSGLTDTKVDVSFPTATDDDVVQHYRVEVLNASQQPLASPIVKILSKFYLYNSSETAISLTISGLVGKTDYYIQASAVDAFGKETPLLSDKFTTEETYVPGEATAPVANLIDVKFMPDGEAKNILSTPGKLEVTKGPGATPTTLYDTDLRQYVSSYSKNVTTYYKVDYKDNTDFMDKLKAGFTFEVYARTKGTGKLTSVGSMQSGGFGWEQVSGGGATQLWIRNGNAWVTAGTKSVQSTTEYYHLVATYDGTNVSVYNNGVLDDTQALPAGLTFSASTSAHWFGIGGDAHTSTNAENAFDGEVALFRMYDKAITRDEAIALYDQLTTRKNIAGFDDLNTMLTVTLPAFRDNVGTSPANKTKAEDLIKDGWKLMSSYTTTNDNILDFIDEAKTLMGLPVTVYGENLIVDPSFEQGIVHPVISTSDINTSSNTDNWVLVNKNNATGVISVTSNEYQDGGKSLKIDVPKVPNWYSLYFQYELKDVAPGKYSLSFYGKSDQPTADFRVEVRTLNGDGLNTNNNASIKHLLWTEAGLPQTGDPGSTTIGNSNMGVAKQISTGWTKYTFDIDAKHLTASNLKYVEIVIRPNVKVNGLGANPNNATYWFDNFKFQEVIEKKDMTGIVLGNKLKAGLNLTLGDSDYSLIDPMHFTIEPKGADMRDVVYNVVDPKVIEINNGVITVKAAGTTKAFMSYSKNSTIKSDEFTVKVANPSASSLQSITLSQTLKDGLNFIDGQTGINIISLFTLDPADYPVADMKYTSTDPSVATIDDDGNILLNGGVGKTTVTISSRIKPSVVSQGFVIGVTKSKDASIHSLTVNGVPVALVGDKYNHTLTCADIDNRTFEVEIEIADDATMDMNKSFTINLLDTPDTREIKFTVTPPDASAKKTYTLQFYNYNFFNFSDIITQKFNSRLIVNNNKNTNGGFTFKKYFWIVDNVKTEGGQIYSTGSNKLSPTSTYGAELVYAQTNYPDVTLTVCPTQLQLRTTSSITAYPNPVNARSVINIEADIDNANYNNSKVEIYNIAGNLVSSTKLTGYNTAISAPNESGMYVVKVRCDDYTNEFKVLVK